MLLVTTDQNKASYTLKADYAGFNPRGEPSGASLTLFGLNGDVVYAKETRLIHNAFKDICQYLRTKKEKN